MKDGILEIEDVNLEIENLRIYLEMRSLVCE